MRIMLELSDDVVAIIRDLAKSEGVSIDKVVERVMKAQANGSGSIYSASIFGGPNAAVGMNDEHLRKFHEEEDRQRLGY